MPLRRHIIITRRHYCHARYFADAAADSATPLLRIMPHYLIISRY